MECVTRNTMVNKHFCIRWIGLPMFVRFTVLPSFERGFIMRNISIIFFGWQNNCTTNSYIFIKDWHIGWIWIPKHVGFIVLSIFPGVLLFFPSSWGIRRNVWPAISCSISTSVLGEFGSPFLLGSLVLPVFPEVGFYCLYPLLKLGVVYNKYIETTQFFYPWLVEVWWRSKATHKEIQGGGWMPLVPQ